MKLFVGNVDYEVTDRELRDLFLPVAGVQDVIIPKGADGRGKGFGFVELISAGDAEVAIGSVHGQMLHGRKLRVEIAKPDRSDRRRGAFRAGSA